MTDQTKCRSCKADIVFAVHHNGGKKAPFQIDDKGEWKLVSGVAHHIGPPTAQLELGGEKTTRWAPHFATCPQAADWRAK